MTESRRRQRGSGLPGPETPLDLPAGERDRSSEGFESPATTQPAADSVSAAEAEADAGTEAIWDTYDQTLAAAVRERDRALDKASSRLASVTAGGYLEYDRSVSVALAAFESAWHNARTAHAAVPR